MKSEYLEKIYSGWLAKIIGIRLGAPVEGWTYEKIKNVYGELDHYPVDYRDFAADDDSNGPLFFLRALEDGALTGSAPEGGFELSAQAVGEALLNYAPFEHGFFWWGGYGVSTEHTAYLNLRNGIPAPRSGSVEQNGHAVAEQIGGQIFIDTWGLVCAGNPDRAARYAREAASVTHGGNGVYGGIFVAACIAYAFDEADPRKIIEKGLSYIPADCEYSRTVRAVMAFYDQNGGGVWRDCFWYIFENFGYDRYPGNCHIIPNIAVMILALLYGEGDFSKTLTICNMCGWDTDCNVGNVATIMGVAKGLDGIDYQKWRRPINDFLACSSVIGSMNIMDIPFGASYIAKLAWAIAGEELPAPWNTIIGQRIDSCHFEYPGSTHAIRVRTTGMSTPEVELINTSETAHTGSRSLKVHAMPLRPAERVYVYKKTYYTASDFHDSRYDPSFSPLVYPGQRVHGSVFLPDYGCACQARLYAHNATTGEVFSGEAIQLTKGSWVSLSFDIPPLDAALIDEAGFAFDMLGIQNQPADLTCMIDDLFFDGKPRYSIDFAQIKEDFWTPLHRELMQFTRLKGLWYLSGLKAHLSCSDFAEVYTGRHDWTDYTASFILEPITGAAHFVNVRVQGALRSYGVGLTANGKLGLYKNENGYRLLAEADFGWETGKSYTITIKAEGATLTIYAGERQLLVYTDTDHPYLRGGIGLSVRDGSHCAFSAIRLS